MLKAFLLDILMLKGKVYKYMKKYLDAYLYDFDELKLDISFLNAFLNGSIYLQNLHIKQDMANKVSDILGIPISLKVGLIKNIKVSLSFCICLSALARSSCR